MVPSAVLMTAGVSTSLLVAAAVQLGCQIFKIAVHSARTRTLAWRRLFAAGGMPSSHTAFVATLTTAVGLRAGVASDLFAIACSFSVIIIFDAIRVRGAIQINSEALRKVVAPMPEASRPETSHDVGHSIPEVAVGMLVGVGSAFLARALHLL